MQHDELHHWYGEGQQPDDDDDVGGLAGGGVGEAEGVADCLEALHGNGGQSQHRDRDGHCLKEIYNTTLSNNRIIRFGLDIWHLCIKYIITCVIWKQQHEPVRHN